MDVGSAGDVLLIRPSPPGDVQALGALLAPDLRYAHSTGTVGGAAACCTGSPRASSPINSSSLYRWPCQVAAIGSSLRRA